MGELNCQSIGERFKELAALKRQFDVTLKAGQLDEAKKLEQALIRSIDEASEMLDLKMLIRERIARQRGYSFVSQFSEKGHATAVTFGRDLSSFCVVIDSQGKPVSQEYKRVWDAHDGVRRASRLSGEAYCYLDEAGKENIEGGFSEAGDFSEGLAFVKKKGESRGYFIDTAGNPAIIGSDGRPKMFSRGNSFSEGLAAVSDENLGNYYIDHTGQGVSGLFHLMSTGDFSEGLAVIRAVEKFQFIDQRGNPVMPRFFKSAGKFSSGLAPVETERGWMFIDKTGKTMIGEDQPFEDADQFSNGLARVRRGGKTYFIQPD
ncbi:WG repeat-containing protein, partial [Patescibacteria group bacterium]